MTTGYLRHSSRMVHKSVYEYIKSALFDLNWNGGPTQPFNTPKVFMLEDLPDEFDGTGMLDFNTVAVTLGDEPAALNEELGGPLASIQFPIFVDCFMETDGIAVAIADDIRDVFCGRLPNTSRFLDVTNWMVAPDGETAVGYRIEFEDVERQRVKNKWHVVRATAVLYFPDAEL